MTETVQIALVAVLAAAVPAFFSYLTSLRQTQLGKDLKEVHADVVDKVAVVRNEVEKKVDLARGEIEVVRTDVNSANTRALEVKAEAEHAKGKLEGKEEEKVKSSERDKGRREAKQENEGGKK